MDHERFRRNARSARNGQIETGTSPRRRRAFQRRQLCQLPKHFPAASFDDGRIDVVSATNDYVFCTAVTTTRLGPAKTDIAGDKPAIVRERPRFVAVEE